MKKILVIVLTWVLIGCVGCGILGRTEQEIYMEHWLEEADLEAEETVEELYEKALKEDILVIYSTTTRMYDVKESFEKQYPGLAVEIYDTRAYDLIDVLRTNYKQQNWKCDLVVISDDTGIVTHELLPLHIVNKYVPADIAQNLESVADAELLSFLGECEQLFYNPAVYETCPIENWWELTEPEWKDNVYMNSPLRSYPAYALFYAVMEHSDLMAAAYEERYGVALEVPKGSSAGKIFWEKLVDNGLGFTTSSNEAVELVGTGGQENPPMVFMISSKIRRSEVGLQSAVAYGVEPCDGVYSSNTISIAGGAENINSAKLFIRWLLGETDGTGEGIGPYMLEGTWPVRTDLKNPSPVDLKDGTIWFTDKQKIGDAEDEILEFWESLQKK